MQYVNRAMNRVTPKQGSGRATHHFNTTGLLMVNLKEIINIAKPGGPNRYAVFQKQKLATSTGAGEYR